MVRETKEEGWRGETPSLCIAIVEVRLCRPPRVYLLVCTPDVHERFKGLALRVLHLRLYVRSMPADSRKISETEQNCA